MNIKIKKLTPESLEDYLHFFENSAHTDIEHDVSCYCISWCSADQKNFDFSLPEIRKNYAVQYIKKGIIQGYLAYCNNRAIGWINANNRSKCTKCYSWRHCLASLNTTEDTSLKIKSIFCFAVTPKMRKIGIAEQLLVHVCREAANEGFDYAEAYPNKKFLNIHDDFMGPVDLYKKCGFVIYREIENKIIMRKNLNF